MRKIVSIAAFGFLISSGAQAQDNSGTALPSNPQRLIHEQDLNRLKPKLEEYHQGKLDTHDGYVIMMRMLLDYGSLKEGDTPEDKALQQEFNLLKKAHPDAQRSVSWVVHSGTMSIIENDFYTSEEKRARKDQEKNEHDSKEKAKNFVPTDTSIFDTLGYDRHAVFIYQYHLDFYNLPPEMKLGRVHPDPKSPLQLYDNGKIIYRDKILNLGLKPFKVMTFQYKIQTSRDSFGPLEFRHFIWACDDLLGGYTASNNEEGRILDSKYSATNGIMPWINKSGEYAEFCGAISIEGKIIYQLPMKQHTPDTLFQLGHMNRDGTSIVIYVGEMGTSSGTSNGNEDVIFPDLDEDSANIPFFTHIRKQLIYTYPDELEIFDAKDGEKFARALKENGF